MDYIYILLLVIHEIYLCIAFLHYKSELKSVLLSVFVPRGVTPTSKFVCVFPFPDGDARRHRDLSWFGQRRALRPAGGREFVLSCT